MNGELFGLPVLTLLTVGGAALLGGLVRGAAGFGGALVMVPLLSTVLHPAQAVSLVLLIEVVGYTDMLRHAAEPIPWRSIAPLTAAALVVAPVGVYGITHLPLAVMTRAIAAGVMLAALVLMTGWRYHRSPGLGVTVGVGAVSGLLDGLAGIPGPPVALFLYGGPRPAQAVRDGLVGYFLLLDVATLAAFAVAGTVRWPLLALAVASLPLSMAANWAAVRLARRLPDLLLRRLALVLVMLAGAALLLR